jgi:hypothetical protein
MNNKSIEARKQTGYKRWKKWIKKVTGRKE